jgi:hypothetical protein
MSLFLQRLLKTIEKLQRHTQDKVQFLGRKMKLPNITNITIVFLLGGLVGCGTLTSFREPKRIANPELLENVAFTQEIERYTDQYLVDIIRINNYNPPGRVKKVFCVSHPVYVETIPNTNGNVFDAYVNLVCAGGDRDTLTSGDVPNPTFAEAKLIISKVRNQDRFEVSRQDTTRDDSIAGQDRGRIFRSDVLSKLGQAKYSASADYAAIRKKAESYYKNLKEGCQ